MNKRLKAAVARVEQELKNLRILSQAQKILSPSFGGASPKAPRSGRTHYSHRPRRLN